MMTGVCVACRWRPGVSRIIVQLSCRPCDAEGVVRQALRENDIAFHLVTKHKVTMAGPNPKKSDAMAKKLLGFDDKLGYTVRGQAPGETQPFADVATLGFCLFVILVWNYL